MESTLTDFFAAVNRNDVGGALSCCAEDIQCTYPDPGRNWQGKERGRTVMAAIFGQLATIQKTATMQVVGVDENKCQVQTRESWGHPRIISKTTYTFTFINEDCKILKMES
jgi:ketosteroid isomerase-like protein